MIVRWEEKASPGMSSKSAGVRAIVTEVKGN
jgi:hypothetical protein